MYIEETDHSFDEIYLVPTPMYTMYKDGRYCLINEYTLRNIQLKIICDDEVYEDFKDAKFTDQTGTTAVINKDGRLSNPLPTMSIIANLMSTMLLNSK